MADGTIVINGYYFGNDKCFGIHRNAMELTRGIDEILDEYRGGLRVEVAVPANCRPLGFRNLKVVELENDKTSRLSKIRWRAKTFPDYVAKINGVGLDMTLALPNRGRYCVFDYDCIAEDYADAYYARFPRFRRWHYMNRVRRSLESAEIIFSNSRYGMEQIRAHYGCPEDKMISLPCAWQHFLRFEQDDGILERFGLSDKSFFFALGSRYPYKNFRWVECAARLNPQYQFVVTGAEIGFEEDDTSKLDNLCFTGYLSDGEIKGLMAHCKAFLQPSLEEGFGIPPLEAMSVGAECIVSTSGSLPEVYGDSVRYIDPHDYENIDLDAILSVPACGSAKETLGRYSWTKSAETVLDAIEERCFA